MWPAANALYRKETFDNYDAQRAILKCVYEGLSVKSFDAALRIEARHFTKLLMGSSGPQHDPLALRLHAGYRQGCPPSRRHPASEGKGGSEVVGAGFMGAGIAYVACTCRR